MKKLSILFIASLVTTLISCGGVVEEQKRPTSKWTYSPAEESLIRVGKEGVEIASINVNNIPTSGIKIAGWDECNIELDVMYNDLTHQSFPFLEKHIPLDCRHFLGEIGHHTLDIAINGVDVTFGFDIINNPDFHGYNCKFIDTRFADERVIQEVTVGYYQSAKYTGEDFPDENIDENNVKRFIGWDYSLNSIHQDMEFRNQFRTMEKRYYGRSFSHDDSDFHLVSTYQKDETIHALTYLGRVQCVTVNHGNAIYHEQGETVKGELVFNKLNPYNEMWNELNEYTFTYGLDYQIVPKYNGLLYGTSGAFSNSTTFLADFDNNYRNEMGEIPSGHIVLEDGSIIDNAVNPNYTKSYEVSSQYLSYTKTVNDSDITGYYRIGLTMAYDIYLSTSFIKLADHRYELLQGSSFHFSPVSQSEQVVLQYSETEIFDSPFKHQIVFTNENLYHLADSLSW